MGFYLSHFFSTHFLQWLVAKNNYISMHKLPIICLGQQSMIFNLRLWFFDGCSVVLQLTFPFSLSSLFSPILVLFFSIHFGVFIFFRLVRSLNEMKKKNVDGSTGNQGMIIKWAELWIKLKIGTLKIYWFSNFS